MVNALFLMNEDAFDRVYPITVRQRVETLVKIKEPLQTAASVSRNPSVLRDVDVILGSWGMPRLDAAFMAVAPRLQAVFYAAGTVKGFVDDAMWDHGICLSAAASANAVTVADFTLAQILFSLKLGWRHMRVMLETRNRCRFSVPGTYRSTVGKLKPCGEAPLHRGHGRRHAVPP